MTASAIVRRGLASLLLVAGFLVAWPSPADEDHAAATWSPKAAAAYLDRRVDWWMGWPRAARDHGTFCISCHTALPYALSRATLGEALAETTSERRLLDNVMTRVRLWNEVGPYYGTDVSKAAESRGTEAVLNALILADHDARRGRLSDQTRTAFDNMWRLQEATGDRAGAWPWLQFGLRPWEDTDSEYYGAALAAIAVGIAPENYRSSVPIQDHVALLRDYLAREYPRQPLSNRVVLLWASTTWPRLLAPQAQASLVNEILREQQPDGGWSLASLAGSSNPSSLRSYVRSWIRTARARSAAKSDGYATGLVAFVLLKREMPGDDTQLRKALAWLARNQNNADGSWPACSLNTRRDPSSDIGRFMSDAATGYAVLALSEASRVASAHVR